jgi:putative hydrolase of the HAD superfamily
MVRTCLFDMGNVLVFFSHERMCEQIGQLCDRSADDVHRLLIESGVQWNYERGRLSPREFHEWFQIATQRTVPFADLNRAASDIFWLNEPILPVLDQLKAQGLRLVLLSNTCVTHFEWVRDHYDVLNRFDACVTSCGAGAIKPEPAIYEAALREIGCDPAECFYTDDIPKYIAAGRQHGLLAEVFTDVPALRGHLGNHGIVVS